MINLEDRIANEEWLKIRKEIGLSYCFNINSCGNFLEQYLAEMQRLIDAIRNNPYPMTLDADDEKQLKKDLYALDGMFVCYRHNMRYYQNYMNERFDLYDTDDELEYPFVSISIPCSHNFNKFLSWGDYFSPVLFENYYMLQVEAIEEFVKSNGKTLPKYLYNLVEDKTSFVVEKLEYFDWNDIPHEKGAHLSLPNYHKISGYPSTLADYEKVYHKYFPREFNRYFSNFVEREWPIRQWIIKNRPLILEVLIHKEDCLNSREEKCVEESVEK